MTRYEVYVLIVCILIFTLLTALLTGLIWYIVRLLLRSIKAGLEDEKIKIEYFGTTAKRKSKALSIIDKAFSAIIFLCLFTIFIGAMFVNISKKTYVTDIPRFQVVASESMSQKNPKNKYLKENNLNDQFDMFDVIVTHKLPAESELKQYDIVVYEVDGILVIHRIVNIEEPNAKHPNERHFLLQGDNVSAPDTFPVLYSQMRAIYRGEKVSFIGSMVMFLQSPAGYLCMLLVLFATIVSPIVDRILYNAKINRLHMILALLSATREDIANAGSFEEQMQILADEYRATKKKTKRQRKPKRPKALPIALPIAEETEAEQTAPAETAEEIPLPLAEQVAVEETAPAEAAAPTELNPYLLGFDPFIGTLTLAERKEFISLFISNPPAGLPTYNVGGNNKLFFRKFFVHLGYFRCKVSDSLMEKISRYSIQLHR